MSTGLVIDEDREFRRAVASWLRERDWTVLEAEDRAAGLGISRQQSPQLVVCDLLKPRGQGFQFCRQLRQAEGPAHRCFIVATGNGCASDRFASLEAGADEYLARPLDFGKFSAMLARLGGAPPAAAAGPAPPPGGAWLKFWGVRGSIPTPGTETAHYGGNTSCVEVRAGGEIIILDSGSGIRPLGRALAAEFKDQPLRLSVLVTHTHWDHIQGFPFFLPAYEEKNEVAIIGFEGARQGLQSALSNQMDSLYFPISMREMRSRITVREIKGPDFKIGAVPVRTQIVHHPGLCVGYRLATPGGDISYLPDVELRPRLPAKRRGAAAVLDAEQRRLAGEHDAQALEFMRDSEVLILDSQYNPDERESHVGWGHSCAEDSVAFAIKANVKRLFMFHHDPDHDDEEVSRMVARARRMAARRKSALVVEAAREGLAVVLQPALKKV